MKQLTLFDIHGNSQAAFLGLSENWKPKRPASFYPHMIILAKGSMSTPQRKMFTRRICETYPDAQVVENLDTPHSKIEISGDSLIEAHYIGKKTLVIGELRDAVRFSEEEGNTCPNYWHFSPYGFCPYGCHYCYLAGTLGIKFSPTVKIFVNLPEMLKKIHSIASRHHKPAVFYVGKLQDGLSLDPLTGYSHIMIPFFAMHPKARLIILTKSEEVENLLDLNHQKHTILSWSLNPDSICKEFEANTPSLEKRFQAMEKCSSAGYPVRAVIMPVIPVQDWKNLYRDFIEELLARAPLDRLTLGGICIYRGAYKLLTEKISSKNAISDYLVHEKSADGRMRYTPELRVKIYSFLLKEVRKRRPDLHMALCLEEKEVWKSIGLSGNMGRCNCVL